MANPHAEYADEIYVPLFEKEEEAEQEEEEAIQNGIFPSDVIKVKEISNYPADMTSSTLLSKLGKLEKPKRSRKPKDRSEGFEQYNEEDEDYIYSPELVYLRQLAELSEMVPEPVEPPVSRIHFTERYNTPDNFRQGVESRDYVEDADPVFLQQFAEQGERSPNSFWRNYNTPDKFRDGIETKDAVIYPEQNPLLYLNRQNAYLAPEGREFIYENFQNDENLPGDRKSGENLEGVYTEGGMVYLKDGGKDDESGEPGSEDLSENYSALGWGFKRPERLDVKKPGPAFSTNNYAFQDEKQEKEKEKEEGKSEAKVKAQAKPAAKTTEKPELVNSPEKKKVGSPMESPNLRKSQALSAAASQESKDEKDDPVDTSYAYIQFKDRITTWSEGSKIVRGVEKLLNLDLNTFSQTRVDRNEVTFKVEPNRQNLNASEVAKKIDAIRPAIKYDLGVEVTSTGVGDKAKLPTAMSLSTTDEHQLWILSFLLCGVIAAVAISGAALFVIKRHSRTRDKLQNLTQPDSEASKDYQDLCRARMATKAAQEKPEGGVVGHRITNLTRESEGSNHSPSSRSSTSSWSEEPALTNMDISTGHMVLSYMEDHLKNKDRLEQEWVALCAYEAEPCATTIAIKGENGKKNRYNDVLPYDHARVVLNELSNISGSDYINASTITDHDPRNPAYIATQGPLPHTAADFWQMVWEQGSVVMVMLTRLTENGTAMCHRYWPEEGSELYHIYEVHLVSEHIWCDDYLVRSFYLKNLKTGETRTVTQFHFLSWPENGVPLSTKALLEFRRKVNKSYRGRSCPIVVHCSDGVGRAGTYCLIDMVLNRMAKGAKEIDIAATLEHIRDQRPLMVRTKQQFEFVLMAVAEEVHAILKALPANHSPPPVLKEKE